MKRPTLVATTVAACIALPGCALLQPVTSSPNSPNEPASAGPSAGAPGEPGEPGDPPKDEEPAGPSTVSVTIKGDCKDTVKVFYGDKPKFGSGKYSTVSSNSRSSHTFAPGDMFWIVDDSQNGVDSTTVDEGTKEITVGCDSLSSR